MITNTPHFPSDSSGLSCSFHLHLSLSEDCRLTLCEVDRGSGYSHRWLDGNSLGGSLWLAVCLHLWIGSNHHGILLVISKRQGSSSSSRWMILLAVFSISSAVCISPCQDNILWSLLTGVILLCTQVDVEMHRSTPLLKVWGSLASVFVP